VIICESLGNGIQVIAEQIPWSKAAAICVLLRVGARYESAALQGISHLIEHLVFKGTTHRRTAFQIVNTIERIGGDINAFTTEEYTGYTVLVPLAYWTLGVEVIADMLHNPLLRPRDIQIERRVILEELAKLEDTPAELVYDLLSALMWKEHPLGYSVLGTVESLQAITRANIVEYMQTYYTPAHTVVSIVGNIEPPLVIDVVKRWFPDERGSLVPVFVPAPNRQTAPAVLLHKRKSKETHLCLGIRALPRGHPDLYALLLLNTILAGGMSSRLFQKLRDRRGLAYYVHSEVVTFADTGMLVINTGVSTANIEQALSLILAELQQMQRQRVAKRELLDAKEHFKGAFVLGLEDIFSYGEWLGETLLLEGKIPCVAEILARIEQVSPDDILRLAHTLFIPENLNLAMIGSHASADLFQQLLYVCKAE
jgi:predicted Zn-dependent peptidase